MNTCNQPKLVTDVLLEVAEVAREKNLRLKNERRIAQEERDQLKLQRLHILGQVNARALITKK